jgi:hypothetical protein
VVRFSLAASIAQVQTSDDANILHGSELDMEFV